MNEKVTKPKVLIVATHPVQYQVPWFRHIHSNLVDFDFEVLYLTIPDAEKQGVGFGQAFQWDIDLFEGYHWQATEPEHLSGDLALDNFMSIRLRKTKHLIKTFKADAVLLTGWQCMGLIQVLISCRLLRIPCLIRAESNNLKPRASYKNLIHRLLLRQYDRYLAIGTANRNFYLGHGITADNIYDCPYFIDNEYFKSNSSSNQRSFKALKEKWQIKDDAFCFCYVGKLNSKKRILDVLNAFRKLNDDKACLVIVGSGELMDKARSYTTQHQLNVRFAGFVNQSELPLAYAVSHCLILASDYDETWGLVVNEAMACSRPAIVSKRSGCHMDLIKEGVTGYSFEFGNTDELALKMKMIKSLPPGDYTTMAEQAQNIVFEHYAISVATDGLARALKTIV